jgi:hypothetical protein
MDEKPEPQRMEGRCMAGQETGQDDSGFSIILSPMVFLVCAHAVLRASVFRKMHGFSLVWKHH